MESSSITKEYFDILDRATKQIVSFTKTLSKDRTFLSKYHSEIEFKRGGFDYDSQVYFGLLWDVLKCYKYLHHEFNLDKPESIAFKLIIYRYENPGQYISYRSYHIIDEIDGHVLNIVDKIHHSETYGDLGENGLMLGYVLDKRNYIGRSDYFVYLYRIASAIAKADGLITKEESEWLANLLKQKESDKKEESVEVVIKGMVSEKGNTPASKLNSLIGLDSVKKEVNTLSNFIQIQKMREVRGLPASPITYHCVFTGNPGTGKTTVARILAEIYRDLGILEKGHLVETDRAGLVAEYVGQTAAKTNKIIDSAIGGVLFIDEAYSLIAGSGNDYGHEAVATLLKRMEDDRGRLVVILAGYTVEMKKFIDSNPGLQSRFNRYIEFPDYTEEDLLAILMARFEDAEYKMSSDAIISAKALIHDAVETKDRNFGNGRFVRNEFEKIICRQANRLSKRASLTNDILSEITTEDVGYISSPKTNPEIKQEPLQKDQENKNTQSLPDFANAGELYQYFWSGFNDYLKSIESGIKVRKPSTSSWYDISIGARDIYLSINFLSKKNMLRVDLYIPENKSLYNTLYSHKNEIEQSVGCQLCWYSNQDNKSSRIGVEKEFFFSVETQQSGYEWIAGMSNKLRHSIEGLI